MAVNPLMGANRFKVGPQALKAALGKLTGRQQTSEESKPEKRSRIWPSLSEAAVVKLARHILTSNRHLNHFEVELGDETTCQGVCRELQEIGCRVSRIPFKWVLEVTCPDDGAASKAA